ncbi:MAG TPA: YdeI/OmpD-associated family protein [Phototrophicaceae bacterium]|nr:YdeI/OmpD-associated family protein [Phototrophicaceae bacterium]
MSLKFPSIEIPEDLLWALDFNQQANSIFSKLPYLHRLEYVAWIESARKPETRARRVEKAIMSIMRAEQPQA